MNKIVSLAPRTRGPTWWSWNSDFEEELCLNKSSFPFYEEGGEEFANDRFGDSADEMRVCLSALSHWFPLHFLLWHPIISSLGPAATFTLRNLCLMEGLNNIEHI